MSADTKRMFQPPRNVCRPSYIIHWMGLINACTGSPETRGGMNMVGENKKPLAPQGCCIPLLDIHILVVSTQTFDVVAVARAPVGGDKEIAPSGRGDARQKHKTTIKDRSDRSFCLLSVMSLSQKALTAPWNPSLSFNNFCILPGFLIHIDTRIKRSTTLLHCEVHDPQHTKNAG
ncbi:hypothetical protein BDW22DRAFT_1068704 [Trametopsis cervina]|nr:hypothetical protein BDW22DRAFT_1068704 [Trametopsis cervina]